MALYTYLRLKHIALYTYLRLKASYTYLRLMCMRP
jgi:hypothetical protein